MSVLVGLQHVTSYRYDRPVVLGPQVIRLRPAPHTRTAIRSYSLKVTPAEHFVNWQQDPNGNWLARFVFPERTTEFSITVDLLADMSVINPFDFFVDPVATNYPFVYPSEFDEELAPFLSKEPAGPKLAEYVKSLPRQQQSIIDSWLPLTFAVNSINRSMGIADLYPFMLPPPVIVKLSFIHDRIHAAGRPRIADLGRGALRAVIASLKRGVVSPGLT